MVLSEVLMSANNDRSLVDEFAEIEQLPQTSDIDQINQLNNLDEQQDRSSFSIHSSWNMGVEMPQPKVKFYTGDENDSVVEVNNGLEVYDLMSREEMVRMGMRDDFTISMSLDQELDDIIKPQYIDRVDTMLSSVLDMRDAEKNAALKKKAFKYAMNTAIVTTAATLGGALDNYLSPEIVSALETCRNMATEFSGSVLSMTKDVYENAKDAIHETLYSMEYVKQVTESAALDVNQPAAIKAGVEQLKDNSLGSWALAGACFVAREFGNRVIVPAFEKVQDDAINEYADGIFKASASKSVNAAPLNVLFRSSSQLTVHQIRCMTEILEYRFFEQDLKSRSMKSLHSYYENIKDTGSSVDYEIERLNRATSSSDQFEFSNALKNALAMTLTVSREGSFTGWNMKSLRETKQTFLNKIQEFRDKKGLKAQFNSMGMGVSLFTRNQAKSVFIGLGLEDEKSPNNSEVDLMSRAGLRGSTRSIKEMLFKEFDSQAGEKVYTTHTLRDEMIASTGYVEMLGAMARGGGESKKLVTTLAAAGFDIKNDFLLMDANEFSTADIRSKIRDLQPLAYEQYRKHFDNSLEDYLTAKGDDLSELNGQQSRPRGMRI